MENSVVFVDYTVCKECKDFEAWCFGTCYKCGRCGRKFNDDGVMVDSGGTHPVSYKDMM